MELLKERSYHTTPIENLPSMLEHNCINCKINQQDSSYTNIPHSNIQERRTAKSVPVSPFQSLLIAHEK